MKKYVILQAPKMDEYDYAPQLVIIDNSTNIGKKKIELLIEQNYLHAGFIEADLPPKRLLDGFCHDTRETNLAYRDLFERVIDTANEYQKYLL